jgi:hypothetical protein
MKKLNSIKRKYLLIKNTSGCTYWSYYLRHKKDAEISLHKEAIEKYGPILVNSRLGWMTVKSIDKILKTVITEDFPDETVIQEY